MKYQMLLLAHDAFYHFEKRANHYDTFMANKRPELWNTRDLPDVEVNNLFTFVRRWQQYFTGKEYLFTEVYADNYDEIQHLNRKRFEDIDLEDSHIQICFQNIFNAFSRCNESGNYESTAASKLAHAMNPDLFIMWDTNIREGYLGSKEEKNARAYVFDFLPMMKNELQELIESCTRNSKLTDTESYDLLENITGNTISKLIDQFNYMNYTMPTEYGAYLGNISEKEKEIMSRPFNDLISFWKNRVTTRSHRDRKRTRHFIETINELRNLGVITAKDRREYAKKWRYDPEDRDYWFNYVIQLLHKFRLNPQDKS